MSGRTGVRNEWAGRRWGTKEFGIAAPYAGQRKVILGSDWVWGMGAWTRRQAWGHLGARSIVVEGKHAVLNKLFDATRSEPRDLVWLY